MKGKKKVKFMATSEQTKHKYKTQRLDDISIAQTHV